MGGKKRTHKVTKDRSTWNDLEAGQQGQPSSYLRKWRARPRTFPITLKVGREQDAGTLTARLASLGGKSCPWFLHPPPMPETVLKRSKM